MTDKQHPITPSSELLQDWGGRFYDQQLTFDELVTEVYKAGADQELEACCKYMQHEDFHGFATELRAARRPKLPRLKEQALLQLDTLNADLAMHGKICDLSQIRRALETLPANELENISYGTYRCSLED